MSHSAPRAAVFLLIATCVPLLARADATVMVDASADLHPISPLIYGLNFPDDAQLTGGRVPVMRWGGNSTTRYNYETDLHNTGADWYFENIPACAGSNPCPQSDPKEQSSANKFLSQAATGNVMALFTIPTIGWVPKQSSPYGHPYDCGCPKSAVSSQDSFDQYDSNCGNGKSGGSWVMCPAATTTSKAVDPAWAKAWIQYIVGKFGDGAGKRIYELDNEPALWSSTHHDVHPEKLSYDELWQRMRDYGAAIADGDPNAEIAGPVEWGWPNYLCSDADNISSGCSATSPDRSKHGGEELVAWLLDQAKSYEQSNGKRILHYLDLHYYPQGGSVPDNTRSLWDASYMDPSWINEKIRLIPRMREWVDQHYPGTKTSISEYDFGDHDTARGAVTYAEVLGIFGREGLDMATAWGPPAATERAFSAFRLFRNYDGAGGAFESTSVRAAVTGSGVQAFAATSATRLTVVLVNEGGSAATAQVQISGFQPGASASVYANDGSATIAHKPDVTLSGSQLGVPLAAISIAIVIIDGKNSSTLPVADAGTGQDASMPSGGGSGAGSGGGAGRSAGSGDAGTVGASTGKPGATGGAAGKGQGAPGLVTADAGTGDAGAGSNAPKKKSGCGCRIVGERSGTSSPAFAIALGLWLAQRRVRRGRVSARA